MMIFIHRMVFHLGYLTIRIYIAYNFLHTFLWNKRPSIKEMSGSGIACRWVLSVFYFTELKLADLSNFKMPVVILLQQSKFIHKQTGYLKKCPVCLNTPEHGLPEVFSMLSR